MGDISSFDLTRLGGVGGSVPVAARETATTTAKKPLAKKSKTNDATDDNVTLLNAAAVRVGATVEIPVRALPLNWKQTPWMESLTLRPKASAACPQKPAPIHTAFVVDDDGAAAVLHVPRFWGLRHVAPPAAPAAFRDMRTTGTAYATTDLRFGATLNPLQAEATAGALRQLRTLGGAMLVLPCGFGKTVCALWLSAQLRRRTLVVVHSDALADQWLQRIGTFLPGAVIGRIQQDVVLVDGCDVVVGMIQSLVKRSYDATTLDSFGLVVVDEAHHVAAPMFSQALRKSRARVVSGPHRLPGGARKDRPGGRVYPHVHARAAARDH